MPSFENWSLADFPETASSLFQLPEHHGIYVGNDSVVSFDKCSRGVLLGGLCSVALLPTADFAGGADLLIWTYAERLSQEEAAWRGLWAVGKSGYHCQAFNCEHLASWCCTGAFTSNQAWYSSFYVDPVFPFGWAAAMAVHSGLAALDSVRLLLEDECCPSPEPSEAVCEQGHRTCGLCLQRHRRRVLEMLPSSAQETLVLLAASLLAHSQRRARLTR
ncbi:unnamed protein product [Effrenium voratum]|nr:unnamed protein product [Effrenium voratum]